MAPPIESPDRGLNAAVAAELRAEQGRRHLSQKALAERSNIPYGTLRRYLNAERHIDLAVLSELCQALGVSALEVVQAAEARMARGMRNVSVLPTRPAADDDLTEVASTETEVEPGDLE